MKRDKDIQAEYDRSDTVIRSCPSDHKHRGDVRFPSGEVVQCCCDCHNRARAIYKAARKLELTRRRKGRTARDRAALEKLGFSIGDRVEYFCQAMLGIGGVSVRGTVVMYRGMVRIKCDEKALTNQGYKKYVTLAPGWVKCV